jgi:PPE-repeat protein
MSENYTRGWKAMNKDKTCRGFKFKKGGVYEIEGELSLCNNGFHFCKDLVLTLEYYPNHDENIYAEVEALGETLYEEPTKHKACTSKIRIIRFLTSRELRDLLDSRNNSGNGNSGDRNSGYGNSGDGNSGDRNSGYGNSGYGNSGDENSGNGNSGNRNSGYGNSGNRNSGNRNSGYGNSGNGNSGNGNSGYGNSGYRNSGDENSGDWNSCSNESGCFNSTNPAVIRVFNKDCEKKEWDNSDKPGFLYFELTEGKSYKECFQESYKNRQSGDLEKLKTLPNFDADVFYEISGIKID